MRTNTLFLLILSIEISVVPFSFPYLIEFMTKLVKTCWILSLSAYTWMGEMYFSSNIKMIFLASAFISSKSNTFWISVIISNLVISKFKSPTSNLEIISKSCTIWINLSTPLEARSIYFTRNVLSFMAPPSISVSK